MAETVISIRHVTPDSLASDLASGHLSVHPDIAADLPGKIGGSIDFLVAESLDGDPRGQVGINWTGATSPETRSALGLEEDETAPNVAFMEVPAGHRRGGIGRALIRAALGEITRDNHSAAFLSVAVGNTAAKALYEAEGFVDTGLRRVNPAAQSSA